MASQSDRDKEYMYQTWSNITENKKMLREIASDDLTPKKHDFFHQNEIHEKIRNDDDYDDWDYGTEPTYGSIKG
jgi:hypothetical protein